MKLLNLLLCILPLSAMATDDDAIKLIYASRMELSNFYSSCEFKYGDIKFPCNFDGKEDFLSLKNDSLIVWKEKKQKVFGAFLEGLDHVAQYPKNKGSFLINNDLYIDILISMVRMEAAEDQRYADEALNNLCYNIPFTALKNKSKQIKAALQKSKSDEFKKYRLLSMLDLSQEEKDSLLKTPGMPLLICARLGDQQAQDTLIKKFESETNYKKKREYVGALIFIGSKKTINSLLINFNAPIFDSMYTGITNEDGKPNYCIVESIRFPILMGFRFMYPENPMFNSELNKYNDFRKGSEVNQYLAEFKTWAKSTYGVEPKDPDPRPVLSQPCIHKRTEPIQHKQ